MSHHGPLRPTWMPKCTESIPHCNHTSFYDTFGFLRTTTHSSLPDYNNQTATQCDTALLQGLRFTRSKAHIGEPRGAHTNGLDGSMDPPNAFRLNHIAWQHALYKRSIEILKTPRTYRRAHPHFRKPIENQCGRFCTPLRKCRAPQLDAGGHCTAIL